MRIYGLRAVQTVLGLSRRVVTGLIRGGFVQPGRGPRNQYVFSFQDTVLLRTAHRLEAARIAPRKILHSLASLRRQLPAELPLSGLRITAVGGDVAVHDGRTRWAVDSGQLLLDFEVAPRATTVAFLDPAAPPAAAAAPSATDWLQRGIEHEGRRDAAGAEQAYREALALDPLQRDAYLNLGALLCERGRAAEALRLFDAALQRLPDDALLHFNRAVALEDGGRHEAAIEAYAASLVLDPALADAHYNIALLQETLGRPKDALRHLSAYRRLAQQQGR